MPCAAPHTDQGLRSQMCWADLYWAHSLHMCPSHFRDCLLTFKSVKNQDRNGWTKGGGHKEQRISAVVSHPPTTDVPEKNSRKYFPTAHSAGHLLPIEAIQANPQNKPSHSALKGSTIRTILIKISK